MGGDGLLRQVGPPNVHTLPSVGLRTSVHRKALWSLGAVKRELPSSVSFLSAVPTAHSRHHSHAATVSGRPPAGRLADL